MTIKVVVLKEQSPINPNVYHIQRLPKKPINLNK